MKFVAKYLLWIGILTALAIPAFAEPRTISWAPVTTYTDGTPIEAGKTVTYSAYWTTDPGLGSLRTIGTGIAATSTQFDPDAPGDDPRRDRLLHGEGRSEHRRGVGPLPRIRWVVLATHLRPRHAVSIAVAALS